MTISSDCGDNSFELESYSSDCDSGHISLDDFPLSQEEIQEIYDELDLDEEGITDDEITRRKRRIFVGGLKFASEDIVLHEYFQQFGKIKEAVVIKDRKVGLSRGYGFVTMACDMSSLLAIMDKSPKLDGRRCNVNLAYIGQKKKPPSRKPDLKLKDLSPLQGQFFPCNQNGGGYIVSPTVVTPNGYYQLGLPPLHGYQPVYQIPQSPQPCYESDTTYYGPNSLPPASPMSPAMYPQQPIYYTQPLLISNHPQGGSLATYPNQPYQPTTVGSPSDPNNNILNASSENLTLDANNNNNPVVAQTTVVPSTYGMGTSQPPPQIPYSPVSSTTAVNPTDIATYTPSTYTDTARQVLNIKQTGQSNLLTQMPVVNNPLSTPGLSHPATGNLLINGTQLIQSGAHTQLVSVPAHAQHNNGGGPPASPYATSPLTTTSIPNQNQIYAVHPHSGHHQPQYIQQPREVVQI